MFSHEQHLQVWKIIRSPFLLPPGFKGHRCEWEQFSCTQAGCLLCGAEHRCPCETCDVEKSDDGHSICRITGCVVKEHEFKDEWSALSRGKPECFSVCWSGVGVLTWWFLQSGCIYSEKPRQCTTSSTYKKNLQDSDIIGNNQNKNIVSPCDVWTFVNQVVIELLDSTTTMFCKKTEVKKLCVFQVNLLHKAIKKNRHKGL